MDIENLQNEIERLKNELAICRGQLGQRFGRDNSMASLLDAIEEQKRERLERFTLAAMQGILADGDIFMDDGVPSYAVKCALCTIAALDREHAKK